MNRTAEIAEAAEHLALCLGLDWDRLGNEGHDATRVLVLAHLRKLAEKLAEPQLDPLDIKALNDAIVRRRETLLMELGAKSKAEHRTARRQIDALETAAAKVFGAPRAEPRRSIPLREGKVSKGGQNPPEGANGPRPPDPKGSGVAVEATRNSVDVCAFYCPSCGSDLSEADSITACMMHAQTAGDRTRIGFVTDWFTRVDRITGRVDVDAEGVKAGRLSLHCRACTQNLRPISVRVEGRCSLRT